MQEPPKVQFTKSDIQALDKVIETENQDVQVKYKAIFDKANCLITGGIDFEKNWAEADILNSQLLALPDLPIDLTQKTILRKAVCLRKGLHGLKQNAAMAHAWYVKLLAMADLPIDLKQHAIFGIADCFRVGGTGLDKNWAETIKLYNQLLEMPNLPDTLIQLIVFLKAGCFRVGGNGIKQKMSEAVILYDQLLAMPGAPIDQKQDAIFRKAECFYKGGQGLEKNWAKAVTLYDQLLAMPDLPLDIKQNVIFRKADCLRIGQNGVAQNQAEAGSLYKKLLMMPNLADSLRQNAMFQIAMMLTRIGNNMPTQEAYNKAYELLMKLLQEKELEKDFVLEILYCVAGCRFNMKSPDLNSCIKVMQFIRKNPEKLSKLEVGWAIDRFSPDFDRKDIELDSEYQFAMLTELKLWDGVKLKEFFKKNPEFCLRQLIEDDAIDLKTKCNYFIELIKLLNPDEIKKLPSQLIFDVCNIMLEYIDQQRALMSKKHDESKRPVERAEKATHVENASVPYFDAIAENAFIPYFDAIQSFYTQIEASDQVLQERFLLSLAHPHIVSNHLWDAVLYFKNIQMNKKANEQMALLLFNIERQRLPERFHDIANKSALILLLFSRAEEQFRAVDSIQLVQTFLNLKKGTDKDYTKQSIRECLGVEKVISFKKLLDIAEATAREVKDKPEDQQANGQPLSVLVEQAKKGYTPDVAAQLINHPAMQTKLKGHKDVGTSDVTTFEDLVVCPNRYPVSRVSDLLLAVPTQFPERLSLVEKFWDEAVAYLSQIQTEQLTKLKRIIEESCKNHYKLSESSSAFTPSFFSNIIKLEKDAAIDLLSFSTKSSNLNVLIDYIINYINNGAGNFDSNSFKTILMKSINEAFHFNINIKASSNTAAFKMEFCDALASIKMEIPELVSKPSDFKIATTPYILLVGNFMTCLTNANNILRTGFPVNQISVLFNNIVGKDDLDMALGILSELQKNPAKFLLDEGTSVDTVKSKIQESINDLTTALEQLQAKLPKTEPYAKCLDALSNSIAELTSFEASLQTKAEIERREDMRGSFGIR